MLLDPNFLPISELGVLDEKLEFVSVLAFIVDTSLRDSKFELLFDILDFHPAIIASESSV